MSRKVKNIIIFQNGNIGVFDEKGKQIPELQEPWLNFQGLRELANVIVRDDPEVEGNQNIPTSALKDYITAIKLIGGEK